MLATLAVQLLVIAQVSGPPRLVTPDEAPPIAAAGEERAAGEPSAPPAAEPPPAGETPRGRARSAVPAAPERPRQHSLLSAEPLRGGSAALAWAGWSALGAMYAIGFTERDDAGVFLDYDWAKSETRIGAMYRRPLAKAGNFDMAGRLAVAWYVNFGADYFYDENHSDRGVEVTPALALSQHAAGGIFSLLAEGPMTVTMKYRAGFLFSPRVSAAFEMPLYLPVTVGARLGFGYRAGSGDAPLQEGRGEIQFLIVGGYQVL
jgi:hypothetical protein